MNSSVMEEFNIASMEENSLQKNVSLNLTEKLT